MTFCDLAICSDNPLLIRLCTELDLLPNFERFPENICDGCGMPTGDAYSSGHLVRSLWDLHMFLIVETNSFSELVIFPGYALSISLGTFSILLMNVSWTHYLLSLLLQRPYDSCSCHTKKRYLSYGTCWKRVKHVFSSKWELDIWIHWQCWIVRVII